MQCRPAGLLRNERELRFLLTAFGRPYSDVPDDIAAVRRGRQSPPRTAALKCCKVPGRSIQHLLFVRDFTTFSRFARESGDAAPRQRDSAKTSNIIL